ncbi:MAG: hypothetical protein GY830_10250 [Bacteroidetes bacterium]|nr:hypothetical protein [Bacteroidota bacterium]
MLTNTNYEDKIDTLVCKNSYYTFSCDEPNLYSLIPFILVYEIFKNMNLQLVFNKAIKKCSLEHIIEGNTTRIENYIYEYEHIEYKSIFLSLATYNLCEQIQNELKYRPSEDGGIIILTVSRNKL